MSTTVERTSSSDRPDVRSAANHSLIARARQRDADAITTMFRQFVSPEEQIVAVEYLGSVGLLFKTHSFACLTDRRVASLWVKSLGEVVYQDGLIDSVKHGILYQPSRISRLVGLMTLGLLNVGGRQQRKTVGLVLSLGDGVSVSMLAHRTEVSRANGIYRSIVLGQPRAGAAREVIR